MQFYSPDTDRSVPAFAPLTQRRGAASAGIGLAMAFLILAVAMAFT